LPVHNEAADEGRAPAEVGRRDSHE
jgi:hypothetical protein